jgi:hypothetical protein
MPNQRLDLSEAPAEVIVQGQQCSPRALGLRVFVRESSEATHQLLAFAAHGVKITVGFLRVLLQVAETPLQRGDAPILGR